MAAVNRCVRREGDSPARAFLWSALEAEDALREQEERVRELESRCAKMTARADGVPGGRGCGPERLWAKLADERDALAALEREVSRRRAEVERALERLKRPSDREAMRLRYLEGLTWPNVCRELARRGRAVGARTVLRADSRALAELEGFL